MSDWQLLSRCIGAQDKRWTLLFPDHPIYTYLADTCSHPRTRIQVQQMLMELTVGWQQTHCSAFRIMGLTHSHFLEHERKRVTSKNHTNPKASGAALLLGFLSVEVTNCCCPYFPLHVVVERRRIHPGPAAEPPLSYDMVTKKI